TSGPLQSSEIRREERPLQIHLSCQRASVHSEPNLSTQQDLARRLWRGLAMCGIVGIMSLSEQPLQNPTLVEAIAARLVHRGPDEEGYYTNPSRTISLGHRRLRIIDLITGRQPLFNEDGSVAITFNGEIYGFPSLRTQLERRGHRFKTYTDTEV